MADETFEAGYVEHTAYRITKDPWDTWMIVDPSGLVSIAPAGHTQHHGKVWATVQEEYEEDGWVVSLLGPSMQPPA